MSHNLFFKAIFSLDYPNLDRIMQQQTMNMKTRINQCYNLESPIAIAVIEMDIVIQNLQWSFAKFLIVSLILRLFLTFVTFLS